MSALERMKLEDIKKTCQEEGVDVEGCRLKAEYIRALETHRENLNQNESTVESVKACVSFSGSTSEEEEEGAGATLSLGTEPGHVRRSVEDMNRVLSRENTTMAPTQQTSSQAQGDQNMLNSIGKMMEENTEKLMEEVRKSQTDTEDRLRKEREDITREVKGLRNDVEEVRSGLVTKKDVEHMMNDLKASQANLDNKLEASNEALVRKFAEKEYENRTGLEGMRREMAELTKKVDNLRTYPVISENRTNSQIMSVVTQFESVQSNVLIRGIPQRQEEDDRAVIRQELEDDFEIFKYYPRDIVRNIVRVGKRNEKGIPRPVKVSFESVRIRDEFLREARELEEHLRKEWEDWKALHPTDYLKDVPGKPRYRKYSVDTPTLIRQKVKEIAQICQLLPVAGPSNMHTPICVKLKNGDAKLMLCSPGTGGKWISEAGGVEAETQAADWLRDYAIKKGYKTKSVMAYTGAGAYLPDMRHLPPELRSIFAGIFTQDVKRARLEDIIRSREVSKQGGNIDDVVQSVAEERSGTGTEARGGEGEETY